MNSEIIEGLLPFFFRHQLLLKLFHFQTKSYGAHKASDAYLSGFLANMDKFMEVAQGEFGTVTNPGIYIDAQALTDDTIVSELDAFVRIMHKLDPIVLPHPGLQAIRDELIADASQLKYLLTFK